MSNPNKQNKLSDPTSIGSKRGYIGTEANNENDRTVGGGGGGRVENWMDKIHNHIQWWRLRISPAERNEYPKLELLGAWEPTGS